MCIGGKESGQATRNVFQAMAFPYFSSVAEMFLWTGHQGHIPGYRGGMGVVEQSFGMQMPSVCVCVCVCVCVSLCVHKLRRGRVSGWGPAVWGRDGCGDVGTRSGVRTRVVGAGRHHRLPGDLQPASLGLMGKEDLRDVQATAWPYLQ